MEDRHLERVVDQLPEALDLALAEHVGGVLPGRHGGNPQTHLPAPGHSLGAQHRVAPGSVGVEREDHLVGVRGQNRQLVRRDRGTHDRHRLLDPRLVRRQHVGVPLHHHRAPPLCDRRPRAVDPVERSALVVELAVGRVQVLRLRVGRERPRAEALDPPAGIPHREGDPRPEAVVVPALPPLLDEPGGLKLRDGEPRLLPPGKNLIPRARREADAEGVEDLRAEPSALQVLPRLRRLRRAAQERGVEVRGAIEHVAQARPALPRLLGLRVRPLALDLDAVPLRERLHGLREGQSLLLLDELDRVSTDPAAEAVVHALLGIDRERRRALVVERTEAHERRPAAPQLRVRRDDLDEVGRLLHPLDRVVGEASASAHSRDSSGSASRLNVAMQYRSVIPAT